MENLSASMQNYPYLEISPQMSFFTLKVSGFLGLNAGLRQCVRAKGHMLASELKPRQQLEDEIYSQDGLIRTSPENSSPCTVVSVYSSLFVFCFVSNVLRPAWFTASVTHAHAR